MSLLGNRLSTHSPGHEAGSVPPPLTAPSMRGDYGPFNLTNRGPATWDEKAQAKVPMAVRGQLSLFGSPGSMCPENLQGLQSLNMMKKVNKIAQQVKVLLPSLMTWSDPWDPHGGRKELCPE